MGKPSKPMSKNSNSKFTTRNSKKDIFSSFAKSSKLRVEVEKKRNEGIGNPEVDEPKP